MTQGTAIRAPEREAPVARCGLCPGPAAGDGCYARIEGRERPVCRGCWEILILSPARAFRGREGPGIPGRPITQT
jgi:hypothetical protein